ncbi:MAG: J domain-containing protein [Pseudomonadota bacterium]
MIWTWNAVLHVILLQAALAFYVLVWPILSKGMIWAAGTIARRSWQDETAEPHAKAQRQYRGKWRDTQYQRAERASETEWQQYRKNRAWTSQGSGAPRDKHLRVLGLTEPVHLLDIKNAYRQLAKDYHPDKFASDQHGEKTRAAAAARMREINAAYDWLRTNA